MFGKLNYMEPQNQNPIFKDDLKDPKHFWLWLVVLVLLAVGASGYFAWRKYRTVDEPVNPDKSDNNYSSSEVEKWQTYRNEEYGFEFKYPLKVVNVDKNVTSLIKGNEIESYEIELPEVFWSDTVKLGLSFSVYTDNDFIAYNWDQGWVFYDDLTNQWYTTNNIKISFDLTKSYPKTEIYNPVGTTNTLDQKNIYENFGFGDAGAGVSYYLIHQPEQNIIVVFSQSQEALIWE